MATTNLKTFRGVSLKIAATICASAVAFCVGFFVSGIYYDRFILPDLIKRYPHDGQIGLAGFVYSLNWAGAGALIALVLGIVWIIRTAKRSEPTQVSCQK